MTRGRADREALRPRSSPRTRRSTPSTTSPFPPSATCSCARTAGTWSSGSSRRTGRSRRCPASTAPTTTTPSSAASSSTRRASASTSPPWRLPGRRAARARRLYEVPPSTCRRAASPGPDLRAPAGSCQRPAQPRRGPEGPEAEAEAPRHQPQGLRPRRARRAGDREGGGQIAVATTPTRARTGTGWRRDAPLEAGRPDQKAFAERGGAPVELRLEPTRRRCVCSSVPTAPSPPLLVSAVDAAATGAADGRGPDRRLAARPVFRASAEGNRLAMRPVGPPEADRGTGITRRALLAAVAPPPAPGPSIGRCGEHRLASGPFFGGAWPMAHHGLMAGARPPFRLGLRERWRRPLAGGFPGAAAVVRGRCYAASYAGGEATRASSTGRGAAGAGRCRSRSTGRGDPQASRRPRRQPGPDARRLRPRLLPRRGTGATLWRPSRCERRHPTTTRGPAGAGRPAGPGWLGLRQRGGGDPGRLTAYDLGSGALRWSTPMVPPDGNGAASCSLHCRHPARARIRRDRLSVRDGSGAEPGTALGLARRSGRPRAVAGPIHPHDELAPT